MSWEQLSLWTDEELGLQGPKKIEKTVAIQMKELREQIAKGIEDRCLDGNCVGMRIAPCDCVIIAAHVRGS